MAFVMTSSKLHDVGHMGRRLCQKVPSSTMVKAIVHGGFDTDGALYAVPCVSKGTIVTMVYAIVHGGFDTDGEAHSPCVSKPSWTIAFTFVDAGTF